MTETKQPMIFGAMIAAMRDVEAVGKDRSNAQQGYKFRGIDDVYNVVHSALSKHGIVTPPRVLERTEKERQSKSGALQIHVTVKVEYDFTAADGSVKVVGPVFGEALDMSDKATNKAMSFAHKYALLETFCIPTEDIAEGDKVTIDAGEAVATQKTTAHAQRAPARLPVHIGREMTEGERVAAEPQPVHEEPPHPAEQETVTPEGAYGPVLGYGANEGKHASELKAHDLEWYIGNERKKLDAPGLEGWKKKKAKAMLDSLLAVRATKFGPYSERGA